jgi:hypothetical protein
LRDIDLEDGADIPGEDTSKKGSIWNDNAAARLGLQ